VGGEHHAQAPLPPADPWYPLQGESVGPKVRLEGYGEEAISRPHRGWKRGTSGLPNRYTDYAILVLTVTASLRI
jgi:hypothetical protein